ncbi:hypothetical protein M409DRAFT_16232 [Zasmidium cellare ATCC 36951]|uniref:Heme haloperoxidase family profile domain-containing protein n=1 Tax=Zasmidium cellare ATCC 36951 TaxID=1080233 RepID=A0A6A6D4A3_ZASCE|nr:uncharacterized protein M409DRAFT_16232 [Zasmidium cellare ATCC 36951]KAF2173963.1 hypothetical protein M409DRAFT_16232 [Zasmidium cellare ATCC 36951]
MILSMLLGYVASGLMVGTQAVPSPVNSHASGHEPAGHEWQKPGPFDSRAPCPGLNSLANHGWLPRHGKNITYDDIKYAAYHGYNYTEDVYEIFYILATQVFTNISTTGNASTFNLEDLARHNTIEQDGSLSRNDIYFGDNLHFSAPVWEPVAEDLGLKGYAANDSYVTIETAAKAYLARQEAAQAANPAFTVSFTQRNGTRGTTALYLATLWDYGAKAAPKAWVDTFFTEERIPYLEGYTTPKHKNTDFIHELFVAIEELVGFD